MHATGVAKFCLSEHLHQVFYWEMYKPLVTSHKKDIIRKRKQIFKTCASAFEFIETNPKLKRLLKIVAATVTDKNSR